MTPRPSLLYLSPVVPAATGNGLAMRAGVVLEILARHYAVSLLVVPLYPSPSGGIPPFVAALCHDVRVRGSIPSDSPLERPLLSRPQPLGRLWRRATSGVLAPRRRPRHEAQTTAEMAGPAPAGPCAVIHVFRLAMLPFARPYLIAGTGASPGRRPHLHLDLDDVESLTHRRLAALYRANGDHAMARSEEEAARRCGTAEDEALRRSERIYVCSAIDQQRLSARAVRAHAASGDPSPVARVYALPNAIRVPDETAQRAAAARPAAPFVFLFVGTLGYYPNEDAARYFCGEVVPLLRRLSARPFRVVLVGGGATEAVRRLAEAPDIRVVGEAPAMAPWYQAADAVVVPIRAGGGTRIKALEAFGYRRPVVSTSVGIEGIAARDGEHVLIGDTAAAFAAACARVMDDPSCAARLVDNAYTLVARSYTIDAVAAAYARFS